MMAGAASSIREQIVSKMPEAPTPVLSGEGVRHRLMPSSQVSSETTLHGESGAAVESSWGGEQTRLLLDVAYNQART